MASDPWRTGSPEEPETGDADWIFASSDPHTLPTERLPDRAEFDRYAAPLLARRGEPALPAGEHETVDLSSIDPDVLRSRPRPAVPRPAPDPAEVAEPEAATGALPVLDEDGEPREESGTEALADAAGAREAAELPRDSYARSGTTPNAEDRIDDRLGWISLPDRFRALGVFDALRDVLVLICLVSALTTTFTLGGVPVLEVVGKVAIGLSLLTLVAVHLLRWLPAAPPLRAVRWVRILGLLPAVLVALGVIGTDLVLSLPLLFASLPEGPPVGLGVGVSLLLLGALVGIEPRAHEGYLPAATARERSRQALMGVGIAAAASLLIALVMIVGRLFTTGWAYSLMAFADAVIAALLLLIVLASALLRERSWFVFSAGAVAGLVIAALADNTLRLEFAAPVSFATGYVWLPFLFAAFGLMISRSFVRTMPISFRRPDWLVYTVRAVEFSAVMHTAAVLWHLLAAIAGGSDVTPGGSVLHLMDAAVCAVFVAISLFARKALLEKPADLARSSGVVAGIVLVVVGFLDVIVNSLATGAGAGLTTGGAALAIGIAVALMLTVPAPVRDEFGAPDLARMFADFRSRDGGRAPLLERIPDVAEERSRKKTFPVA